MEAGEYLDVVRDRSSALLVSAGTDLNAQVPTCPGWTVARLVDHVGGTWGWAAAILRTGARNDVRLATERLDDVDVIGWAQQQAAVVLDALDSADPDSNCWTFGPPRSRLFWFRRMALETAVHAWDVQRAVAHAEPIATALASGGIDEFLDVMLPRSVKGRPDGWTGQSLHLHCTDSQGEWTVRLGPDAVVTVERAHSKGDVGLRGPASSLYLWCLNRLPTTELEVFGDRAVADRWTSHVAF